MILQQQFTRLDDAKAEAAAQSMNKRFVWVVDHVEDYQQENYLIVLGDSEADAPGAFISLFVQGEEQGQQAHP